MFINNSDVALFGISLIWRSLHVIRAHNLYSIFFLAVVQQCLDMIYDDKRAFMNLLQHFMCGCEKLSHVMAHTTDQHF